MQPEKIPDRDRYRAPALLNADRSILEAEGV
jgi:hypothetical protein